jgi:hypothetical protein
MRPLPQFPQRLLAGVRPREHPAGYNWGGVMKGTCIAVGLLMVMATSAVKPAYAQPVPPALQKTTLGDLLDHGGRKLSQAEMQALIAGATMSGMQGGNYPDVTFTSVHSADGAVNGNAWRTKVWFTKIKGKWSIDASGQLCSDLMNDRQEKIAGCQLFYAVGTDYYAVRGDNRAAEAAWRTISR